MFNIECREEHQDNVVQDLKDRAMKQYINSRIINSIIINHDDLLYHIVTCSAPGRTDNKQRDLEKQQSTAVKNGKISHGKEFTDIFRRRFMWFGKEDLYMVKETRTINRCINRCK